MTYFRNGKRPKARNIGAGLGPLHERRATRIRSRGFSIDVAWRVVPVRLLAAHLSREQLGRLFALLRQLHLIDNSSPLCLGGFELLPNAGHCRVGRTHLGYALIELAEVSLALGRQSGGFFIGLGAASQRDRQRDDSKDLALHCRHFSILTCRSRDAWYHFCCL